MNNSKNAIPLYNKEKIIFERDEKEGFSTLINLAFQEKFHIINKTTKEIAELCDGKNNIDEIIDKFHNKYIEIERDKIRIDVEQMLYLLDRNELLEWKNDFNPFAFDDSLFKKQISENINVCKASPYDFKEITKFLNNEEYKNKFNLINPLFLTNGFNNNEVILRYRLFNYSEQFYFLEKDNVKIALIGILDEYPISNKATLSSCIVNESSDNSIKYFEILINNILDDLKEKYTKLKCCFLSNHPQQEEIIKCFEKVEFIKEGEFKHEYNENENEIIYSKYFV